MDTPSDAGFASHLRHEVVVNRPIAAVFAVATTARHWPAWHPATVRVEGAIDEPARRGERIVEHVRIAGHWSTLSAAGVMRAFVVGSGWEPG